MIIHVALEGVMEGALGLGLDVCDTAARLLRAGMVPQPRRAQLLEQRVVSHDGRPVPSVQRRSIAVDGVLALRSIRAGDVLVLPGVFATKDSSIERLLARPDVQRVVDLLPRAAAKGAVIAASCSATFLLAAAGLLDGRSATTTWWLMPFFARRFPRVELRADRMVIDNGTILTAGSAFAHADLMLAIVARVTSPSLSNLAARYLLLDARASQSRYMVLDHLRSFDPLLQSLEAFVAANMTRQLTLDELARAAKTSPRTLARRVDESFSMTPQRFVQRIRVAHAVHLLETTHEPVEAVARHVGYADPTAFRRVFRKHTGESPRSRRGPTPRARDSDRRRPYRPNSRPRRASTAS
jgi:transcriptional regulator GlxA family with amidase domain